MKEVEEVVVSPDEAQEKSRELRLYLCAGAPRGGGPGFGVDGDRDRTIIS